MRVLIDTNILISAALNSSGTPYKVLLTGDKDFLESGITCPRIMSAAEFVIEDES